MADIYDQFKDFKSFEAVFFNEQNQLLKLFCDVKTIEHDKIIISANNKKNKNVSAKVGNELKVHIYTDNGIYSAVSRVLKVNNVGANTEYVITYPSNSKHSQRREYFRADISVDFKLTIISHETTLNIESKTKNVCGKGMCYISDKPFPEHESVEIDLFFSERTITTLASLVYSKPMVVGSRPKFIHAFTFTNISKNNIDFIVKKCFLHQLELRKKQVQAG